MVPFTPCRTVWKVCGALVTDEKAACGVFVLFLLDE